VDDVDEEDGEAAAADGRPDADMCGFVLRFCISRPLSISRAGHIFVPGDMMRKKDGGSNKGISDLQCKEGGAAGPDRVGIFRSVMMLLFGEGSGDGRHRLVETMVNGDERRAEAAQSTTTKTTMMMHHGG